MIPRWVILAWAAVAVALAAAWHTTPVVRGSEAGVLVIEIDGAIEPLTVDHLARGLDEARQDGSTLVVIRLDTPGAPLD